MAQKSKLIEGLENNVIQYVQKQAEVFSERAKVYSEVDKIGKLHRDIEEAKEVSRPDSKRIHSRSPELMKYINNSIEDFLAQKDKELLASTEKKKELVDVLETEVVLHSSARGLDILLPIKYEEVNAGGIIQTLYDSVTQNIGASKTKDYHGVVVIKTASRNAKEVAKQIKKLANSVDFEKAKIDLKVVDLSNLLNISRQVASVETSDTQNIQTKELLSVKDIQTAMGYSNVSYAYQRVREYCNEKKLPRQTKFSAEEYRDVLLYLHANSRGQRAVSESTNINPVNIDSPQSGRTEKRPIPVELRETIKLEMLTGTNPDEVRVKYIAQNKELGKQIAGFVNLLKSNPKYQNKSPSAPVAPESYTQTPAETPSQDKSN